MALLDPLLQPLLVLKPLYLILLTSFFLTVIITIIYKYTTDQSRVKFLRAETKKLQKELRNKELQADKEQFEAKQKHLTAMSMEMMKSNFKPMLFTMLPVFLILGWMSSHLALDPIAPGEFFTVDVFTDASYTGAVVMKHDEIYSEGGSSKIPIDGKTIWKLRSQDSGRYILQFKADDTFAEKAVKVTDVLDSEIPSEQYDDGPITAITVHQEKLTPLGDFSIRSWKPGWLAVYIVISIVMSLIIRKALGVH